MIPGPVCDGVSRVWGTFVVVAAVTFAPATLLPRRSASKGSVRVALADVFLFSVFLGTAVAMLETELLPTFTSLGSRAEELLTSPSPIIMGDTACGWWVVDGAPALAGGCV